MHVPRIDAEVQDVVLSDAEVLEQFPRAVLETHGPRPALALGYAFDGLVESDVGFFPVERADKLSAKRVR